MIKSVRAWKLPDTLNRGRQDVRLVGVQGD
jgi:hypothetical protein